MLAELLGSGLRAKVIGWLFTHADEEFFVRQLGFLLGEDSTNLSRELARLARLGVLSCKVRGRQKHYRANPDCPIYAELRGIAAKTAGMVDILRLSLAGLRDSISAAFVYGSMARAAGKAGSDVDLMIVGRANFGDVVSALQNAQDRLGREVNPSVYSEDDFANKLARGNHFLRTVMEGPRLLVIGDEHALAGLAQGRVAG